MKFDCDVMADAVQWLMEMLHHQYQLEFERYFYFFVSGKNQ
jgi:hypothetical protein